MIDAVFTLHSRLRRSPTEFIAAVAPGQCRRKGRPQDGGETLPGRCRFLAAAGIFRARERGQEPWRRHARRREGGTAGGGVAGPTAGKLRTLPSPTGLRSGPATTQRRTNGMAVSTLELTWFAPFDGADIGVSSSAALAGPRPGSPWRDSASWGGSTGRCGSGAVRAE
jgi:hypothetical protein